MFPAVVDFITKQGRMKFVRPLYRLGYWVPHTQLGSWGRGRGLKNEPGHKGILIQYHASSPDNIIMSCDALMIINFITETCMPVVKKGEN